MSLTDLDTLRAARAVLDRHGFDAGDLRACIAAAEQANEDERLDEGGDDGRIGSSRSGVEDLLH